MDFKGVIIEESLKDNSVLKEVKILKTVVEEVTSDHKTPWLKQWTLHTVGVPEEKASQIAQKISQDIETEHASWYADFKNKDTHYIIFPNKIFKIERNKPEEYQQVIDYGVSLGIPDYQLDFSPDIKE